MSLQWLEGFELPFVNTQYAELYAITSNVDLTISNLGDSFGGTGRYLSLPLGTSLMNWYKDFVTPWSTTIFGFRIRIQSAVTPGVYDLFNFADGSARQWNAVLQVVGSTHYRIQVTTESSILATIPDGNLFFGDNWYYVEIKLVGDLVSGSVEVRVNESVVASQSGVQTHEDSATVDRFRIEPALVGEGLELDDIYIANELAGTYTDYLGDTIINMKVPQGIDTNNDWTIEPSNYSESSALNPNLDDELDSYVYTDVDDSELLVVTTPLPTVNVGSGSVLAVQQVTVGNNISSILSRFRSMLEQSGSPIESATYTIPANDQEVAVEIHETNPCSGGAWLNTDFGLQASQLRFGFKKKT